MIVCVFVLGYLYMAILNPQDIKDKDLHGMQHTGFLEYLKFLNWQLGILDNGFEIKIRIIPIKSIKQPNSIKIIVELCKKLSFLT